MKIENVIIERGNVRIYLKLRGIRNDIIRVETTAKTRGMEIPEYFTLIYDGSTMSKTRAEARASAFLFRFINTFCKLGQLFGFQNIRNRTFKSRRQF